MAACAVTNFKNHCRTLPPAPLAFNERFLMFGGRRGPEPSAVSARTDHEPGIKPSTEIKRNEDASPICGPRALGGSGHPLNRSCPEPVAARHPKPVGAAGPAAAAVPAGASPTTGRPLRHDQGNAEAE